MTAVGGGSSVLYEVDEYSQMDEVTDEEESAAEHQVKLAVPLFGCTLVWLYPCVVVPFFSAVVFEASRSNQTETASPKYPTLGCRCSTRRRMN